MRSRFSVTLRPYTQADTPEVFQLIQAATAAMQYGQRATLDALGNLRMARYVPASSEHIVATNQQGRLLGYAYLSSTEQGILHELGGAVHPESWGLGIGAQLIQWAEQRAIEQAAQAPKDAKILLQTNLFAVEERAITLFESQGFRPVREWVHMVTELTQPPAVPALPPGLTLRPMDLENDWDLVGPAMDAAFADHWGVMSQLPESEEESVEEEPAEEEVATDESFSNSPGFCFILLEQDTVIGGVLCNAKLVERGDTGRVGSIFVRPGYRRRGIGQILMLTAFRAFWDQGIRRIILDTDAASFTGAPQFYTSLGMRPYRQEWLYEKTIREGREFRRLEL